MAGPQGIALYPIIFCAFVLDAQDEREGLSPARVSSQYFNPRQAYPHADHSFSSDGPVKWYLSLCSDTCVTLLSQ